MTTGLQLQTFLWSIRTVAGLAVRVSKVVHHTPEVFEDEVDLGDGTLDNGGETEHQLLGLHLFQLLDTDSEGSSRYHGLLGQDELVLGGGQGGYAGSLADDAAGVLQAGFIAEMLEEAVSCAGRELPLQHIEHLHLPLSQLLHWHRVVCVDHQLLGVDRNDLTN